MQKEKNVSKVFFTLVCLLCCSYHIHAQQQLLGIYYVEYRFNDFSTKYTFNEDGIFSTEHSGDLGIESYGKGHYFIKKDSLILDYNLTPLKTNSYHTQKYYENTNDSIVVHLNILDMKRNPIQKVQVAENSSDKVKKSDIKGTVSFTFLKSRKKVQLHVADFRYGVYYFDIWTHLSHDIDVFLKKDPNNATPRKGGIQKFKIIEHTEELIKLKNKNDNILIWKKKK